MANLSSSTFARVVVALNFFLGIWAMVWIRADPARQHGNARALRACIWAELDKLPLVRTLLPQHAMAIFFGISGTCLSSFVLSIERLTLLLQLTQALFVTRKRHQLTCRPHHQDLAANDPSHSMKSSIIAWPSKQSVLSS